MKYSLSAGSILKGNSQIIIVIQYTDCNAKVMSIVVSKRYLSVLLKTSYCIHIRLFLCRMLCTSCMRLQCCLQNSSAAKGSDRCALVSNGVKKVCQKAIVNCWQRCKEVMIREKVALLVLDAKVVTAARCCSKSAV